MKEDYVPGITAQQFLVLNKSKKYVDSLRETEFYTLLLLLQHDYAAAFEANPYAQKPNSTNPFGVIPDKNRDDSLHTPLGTLRKIRLHKRSAYRVTRLWSTASVSMFRASSIN